MVGFEADDGPLFGKGSKVEVSSDEEGFKGAWYRATILESHRKSIYKRKKKVLVEYEALVMEDGSRPLVEYIDPAYIRPLPPEDSGCQDFEVNDIVDAGYRDGWWVGTIRKVLEGSRYRVYFDNPPDIIDFDGRDLRLHWNWFFGNWVRPVKEQMAESIFSSGAAVEVNPDSPSLCDVWFPAIVVKDYGNNNFLVKYNSAYGEDMDAVKIDVDLLHIRPIPPPFLDRSYELLEKVDTSYGTGWRGGVITKDLAGGRYNVFFKQGNEDKELSQFEIRPHLEWIDGKWISASKEIFVASDWLEQSCDAFNNTHNSAVVLQHESTGASHNSEVAVLLEGGGASLNSEVDVQLEMTGVFKYRTEDKTPHSTSIGSKLTEQPAAGSQNSPSYYLHASKKRFRIASSNSSYMHSRSLKDTMQEDYEEVPSFEASKLNKGPLEMLTKETTHGSATPKKGGSVKRFARSPAVVSWDFSQPESTFSGKNVKAKNQNVDEAGCLKMYPATRKRRSVKLKSNITPVSAAGKRNRIRDFASIGMNEDGANGAKVNVAFVPVICALKARGIKDSKAENSSQLENEEPLMLMMGVNEKTNNRAGDKSAKSMGGSQKRKRGRPCKLVVSDPNVKEAGEVQQGAGGGTGETGAEDCIFSEKSRGGSQKRKRGRPCKLVVSDLNVKEAGEVEQGAGGGIGETGSEDCIFNEKSRRGSQKRKRGRPCKLVVSEPNLKEAGEVQQGAGGGTGETAAEDCIFSEVIIPVLQQLDATGASIPGTAEVSQKDCTRKEACMAITVVSDDIADDDQPLSSWFGGNHSSSLEELRLASGRVVNGGRKRRERWLGSAPESSVLVTVDDRVPSRTACLPFVKGSPIWQTIESMEVFQIFPQEPHFYPLAECKEEHREGSAIGMMVTFASLCEKISTLQIDDPISLFCRTLESLDDLEKHGFNVTRLKDRVSQLLSIKEGHVQLLNGSKDFEKELVLHIQETTTLDEEASEIERKLSQIHKQLEAIKSMKEAKDDEIAKVRSEMESTNSCIQNIRSDFQKQATASWKLP